MRFGSLRGTDIAGGGETEVDCVADDFEFRLFGKALGAKFKAEVGRRIIYYQYFAD